MVNKLLGMAVWNGAKWYLRRKYGAAMAPKPLLAGALLVLILAIVLATRQRGGDS